jgi:hypothetical protein
MPIDRRRDDIAAAVAAYDGANPNAPLPRHAARLLAVMFPSEGMCANEARRPLRRKGSAETGFLRRCGASSRPGSFRGTGWPRWPVPIGCTCRRCSHDPPSPREGVRPWPRRPAGPQRQGPHRGLRPPPSAGPTIAARSPAPSSRFWRRCYGASTTAAPAVASRATSRSPRGPTARAARSPRR